jgi:hypothetical protein
MLFNVYVTYYCRQLNGENILAGRKLFDRRAPWGDNEFLHLRKLFLSRSRKGFDI